MKQNLTDIQVEYDDPSPIYCDHTRTISISKNPVMHILYIQYLASTAEAEYIAATTCCTQVLWMKQTLTDIQVEYDEPIPIYCDNTSAINISKNSVMHSKTKHNPIKYHFLREQVIEKNIKVE